MEAYRRAWETRDADGAASLFTADATYQVTPFDQPLRGRSAIRKYWEQAVGGHRNVRFQWSPVLSVRNRHVVEWRAKFTRLESGRRVQLRGVMLIELRGKHISRFRECWHRKELRRVSHQ